MKLRLLYLPYPFSFSLHALSFRDESKNINIVKLSQALLSSNCILIPKLCTPVHQFHE